MKANAAAGRMLALAVLALWVLPLAEIPEARGEAFPRLLEDIKIYGKGEAIEFIFSQPYEGTPAEEHKPGLVSLNFGATGSQMPVRELRPRGESYYKQIKVVQNQYSTTVTLVFKDAGFSLKNRLHYTREGNRLLVDVGQPGSAQAPVPALRLPENQLLSEMEQKIAAVTPARKAAAGSVAQPASQAGPAAAQPAAGQVPAAPGTAGGALAQGGISESDFFVTLATMVAALAVIVLVLYGVLFLYKHFLGGRLGRFTGGIAFKQVASFAVGPRQRIVILEINGEMIACGVTPSQITFLTRLSGGAPQATRKPAAAADAASDMPMPLGSVPAPETAGTDAAAEETAKPDPVHQFAELLKQKVRSLKRIN
jgi:flagellar protein FliO/FliZ